METPNSQIVLRDTASWSLVRSLVGSTHVVMHNTKSNEIALGTARMPADEDYEEHNYFSLLEDSTRPRATRGVEPDAMNSGYCKRFFVQQKRLGMGADGAVYLVTHCINGVELGQFALKKVPVGDNYDWLKIGLREVKTLEALRQHPNIVNYKHSWLEMATIADFGPVVPCLHILMEYVDGEDYVMALKQPLDVNEIWHLFLDLTFGLDYLHSKGIIHRDVKGPNMLLSKVYAEGNGLFKRYKLMISDFGTAIFKKRVGSAARTGNTGTPEWVPPELIKTQGSLGDYDVHCDIWGLGLILYFLAYSKLPWTATREHEDNLNEEIIMGLRNLPTTPVRPIEMQRMILALMNREPSKRPLARDILLSPFIQNLIRTLDDPVQEELHNLVLLENAKDHRPKPKSKVPEVKALTLLDATESAARRRKSMTAPVVEEIIKPLPLKALPIKPVYSPRIKSYREAYTLLHLVLFSVKVGCALMLCPEAPTVYSFVSLCLAAFVLVLRDDPKPMMGAGLLEWFWSTLWFSMGGICNKSLVLPASSTLVFAGTLLLNFNREAIKNLHKWPIH